LFRVALAYLKLHEDQLKQCTDSGEVMTFLSSECRMFYDADRLIKVLYLLLYLYVANLLYLSFCFPHFSRLAHFPHFPRFPRFFTFLCFAYTLHFFLAIFCCYESIFFCSCPSFILVYSKYNL
jgi:hypothetical protein